MDIIGVLTVLSVIVPLPVAIGLIVLLRQNLPIAAVLVPIVSIVILMVLGQVIGGNEWSVLFLLMLTPFWLGFSLVFAGISCFVAVLSSPKDGRAISPYDEIH